MKANLKILLTALITVSALGLGPNAYADGRGDGRGDRDGWRDGDRYEQRWNDDRNDRDGYRNDHWKHRHHPPRGGVYYYAPPPGVYGGPVFYGPTVYRAPYRGSVVIDLPTIVFR